MVPKAGWSLTINKLLVLIAVVLFVIAAFGLAKGVDINLVALGLAFWATSTILQP